MAWLRPALLRAPHLLLLLCAALLASCQARAAVAGGGGRRLLAAAAGTVTDETVEVQLAPGQQLQPGDWVPAEVQQQPEGGQPKQMPKQAKQQGGTGGGGAKPPKQPKTQPKPSAAPVPVPQPVPQPKPVPVPAPAVTTQPAPQPQPEAQPQPQPKPLTPSPEPIVVPVPVPEAAPTPVPEPAQEQPAAKPEPQPEAAPTPVPEPAPEPQPKSPSPSPSPSPPPPPRLAPPPKPTPPPRPPAPPPLLLGWRPLLLWVVFLIAGFCLGLLCCFWKRKQVWKMFRLLPAGSADERAPLGELSEKGEAGGGWYGAAGESRFEPPLAPPPLGNMRDAGSEMPDWAPAAVDGGGANLRAYKQMRDRVTGPDEALPADGGPEAGCRAPCLPSRKKPAPEQAQLPGR